MYVLAAAVTSSHFLPFCSGAVNRGVQRFKYVSERRLMEEKKKAKKLKETHLPEVEILAQGGFIVFNDEFERGDSARSAEKSQIRVKQFNRALDFIQNSDKKVCLLVLGSNDFKNFVIKNGEWLPLGKGAVRKWSNLSLNKQVYFSYDSAGHILCREIRQFIEEKVGEYMRIILSMLRDSEFEFILHSSLLEREWENCNVPHLDILFAHINCYLNKQLLSLNRKAEIQNRFGKIVKFKFVNVAYQYFEAKREGVLNSIFREPESWSEGRTHRSETALIELAKIYRKEIIQALKVVS